MRNLYPVIEADNNLDSIAKWSKEVTRLREVEDLPDFTNLNQQFVSGRSTTRIPSTPADVLATDNEGDIVTDAPNGFEYKLVDNSGTLAWDRRTLDIAW